MIDTGFFKRMPDHFSVVQIAYLVVIRKNGEFFAELKKIINTQGNSFMAENTPFQNALTLVNVFTGKTQVDSSYFN